MKHIILSSVWEFVVGRKSETGYRCKVYTEKGGGGYEYLNVRGNLRPEIEDSEGIIYSRAYGDTTPEPVFIPKPGTLPEGKFSVVVNKFGKVLVVPDHDRKKHCFLFVGYPRGVHHRVDSFGINGGRILKTFLAGTRWEGFTNEVVAHLKLGQGVGFHSVGPNLDHICSYIWNGYELSIKRLSRKQWYEAFEI